MFYTCINLFFLLASGIIICKWISTVLPIISLGLCERGPQWEIRLQIKCTHFPSSCFPGKQTLRQNRHAEGWLQSALGNNVFERIKEPQLGRGRRESAGLQLRLENLQRGQALSLPNQSSNAGGGHSFGQNNSLWKRAITKTLPLTWRQH